MSDEWKPPAAHVTMNGSDQPLEAQSASLGTRPLRRTSAPARTTSPQDLSPAEREALATLPLPGWQADRVFVGRGRQVSYSATWRKSAKHLASLETLERRGLVERKTAQGETLWRLTRPEGIEVRQSLENPRA